MRNLKTIKLLFPFFVILSFTFCATIPQDNDEAHGSKLTVGMVKKEIKKGITNQAEIMQIFGAPNLVTKNRKGDEVWNYNRMSFKSVSTRGDSLFLFYSGGSKAVASTTTKSFDLIIIFDENDIVKDYSVIAASY